MGRRMAEIGLPGQQLSVLDGGDVDTATGRLLTVAELQAALLAAQALAASRDRSRAAAQTGPAAPEPDLAATLWSRADPADPTDPVDLVDLVDLMDPPIRGSLGDPLVAGAADVGAPSEPLAEPAGGRSRLVQRWASWRRRSVEHPSVRLGDATLEDTTSGSGPNGLMAAPAGFTGPAAVQAWEWLTTAAPAPRVLVCGAGGGVGVTTVVAALAGLLAAARPDRVLAIEVARRDYSPLTRQVCGPVDPVTAGTWLTDRGDRVLDHADLAGLPAGPSGARVVQAGAHWWPRLVDQLTSATAVVADLGSIDHADTRTLLLAHRGPAVMVARADSAGVSAALAALTALDAAGLPHRPVLVLCDAAGSRPGVLRTAQRLAATAADVLMLPKAPVLRRCPIPIGGWDRALSSALADLTCALARPDPMDPAPLHRSLPIANPTDDTDGATADRDATTATTTATTHKEML